MQSYLPKFCCLFWAACMLMPLSLQGQVSEWAFYNYSYTFQNDKFTSGPEAFPGNVITAFTSDANGQVWVGIANRGLYKFDGSQFSKVSGRGIKTLTNYIRALAAHPDGSLWVGTNKGLLRFKDGNWEEIAQTPQIPMKAIHEIFVDSKDQVWVSGFDNNLGLKGVKVNGSGLSIYRGGTWTNFNKNSSDIPSNFVEDFCEDKDGNVWMAMGSDGQGVVRCKDGADWKVFDKSNSELKALQTRAIAQGPDGKMYFGTPKGLVSYDGSSWSVKALYETFGVSALDKLQSLDQPDVMSIAFDQNGAAYMGTRTQGVIRVQDGKLQGMHTENSPMTSNAIQRVYVDKDNRKWFVTGAKSENVLDVVMEESATGFMGLISFREAQFNGGDGWTVFSTQTSAIPSERFYKLDFTDDNTLWAVDGRMGLTKYDGEKWEYVPVEMKGGLLKGLYDLHISQAGEIYAAGQQVGLVHYKDGSFTVKDKKNSPLKNPIVQLTTDGEGNLWFATFKGVMKYDGSATEVFDKKSAGLPANSITHIFSDSKGRVWMGCNKGVGLYDNGSWTFWNKKNSNLPGNYVEGFGEDNKGNVWAFTLGGVGEYDGSKWIEHDKILEFSSGFTCLTSDKNGHLYLGTSRNGLLYYDGTSWKLWNQTNSPISFLNVTSVTVSPDNDLWVSISKPAKTPGSGGVPSSTPTEPSLEDQLREKIDKFDPDGAVLRLKR